ncbi:hypothetical protein V6N12_013802 [Hibiscus sabdariffa]|uniref:RNase H type-1 domain-containing protein n=1 Tax=Hibiscus sabdariffa TaxID=183260 RepID=A0ABR2CV90_9ROSI
MEKLLPQGPFRTSLEWLESVCILLSQYAQIVTNGFQEANDLSYERERRARAEVAGTNGKSVEATVAEVDDTLNAELGPSTVEKGSADQVPPAARNVTTPCGSADTVQSDQPCPVVPTKAADATAADSDQPVHDNSTTPTNSAEDNAAARVSIGPVRSSKRVIQGRYEDYLAAASPLSSAPALQPASWSPPPAGTVTLNVDGSLHSDGGPSIGVVARDSSGQVLYGLARHMGDLSKHAALLAGLNLALERG